MSCKARMGQGPWLQPHEESCTCHGRNLVSFISALFKKTELRYLYLESRAAIEFVAKAFAAKEDMELRITEEKAIYHCVRMTTTEHR